MNSIGAVSANVEILGLQNDTIQDYADRLTLRLLDHPVFTTHMIEMNFGEDSVELIFDAVPLQLLEPLKKVIGDRDKIEIYAFPKDGKQVTGVKVFPQNLRKTDNEKASEDDGSKDEEGDVVGKAVDDQDTAASPDGVVEALLSDDLDVPKVNASLRASGFDGSKFQPADTAIALVEDILHRPLGIDSAVVAGSAKGRYHLPIPRSENRLELLWCRGEQGHQFIAHVT